MMMTSFMLKVPVVFSVYTAYRFYTRIVGDVDPCRDLEIISDELFAKDLQLLAGAIDKVEKLVTRAGDKTLKVIDLL